jgi:hypothetical protein
MAAEDEGSPAGVKEVDMLRPPIFSSRRSDRSQGLPSCQRLNRARVLLSLVIIAIAAGNDARAEDCIDYGDYLGWTGHVVEWVRVTDAAATGDHLYVASTDPMGGGSFYVLDLSIPTSPAILGSVGSEALRRFALTGSCAYVAGDLGLQVVDISNSTTPEIIGSVDTPGNAQAAAVVADHAYVADGESGLQVVDISDPTTPSIVGDVGTPGAALDVAVAGDYAYAVGSFGLLVLEISSPATPEPLGSIATPGNAQAVVLAAHHAFIADDSGLQVVDITDPTTPAIIGSVCVDAHNVLVEGDRAYVVGHGGLHIVDISSPASPTILGSIVAERMTDGVTVAGDYAYVGGWADNTCCPPGAGADLLRIANISNPAAPTMLGSLDTPGGAAHHVAVVGKTCLVPDGESGLQVVDISIPTLPTIVGNVATATAARDVAAKDPYAYVTADGLHVVDISTPCAPRIVGSVATAGGAVDVAGDLACVVGHESLLEVVDISNPTTPMIIGTASVGEFHTCTDVVMFGDYAYVSSWRPGPRAPDSGYLFVIDLSTPSSPYVMGGSRVGSPAHGVAVAGEYAYVTEGSDELLVLDASNLASPEIIGSIHVPGSPEDVTVAGDYAYVTTGAAGLQVVDISDPGFPLFAGCAPVRSEWSAFNGVAVAGHYAYVTDGLGLVVLPAQCGVPVPVQLVGFELESHGGAVTLTWETSFEEDHVGFHVERAEDGNHVWVRISDHLIHAGTSERVAYEFLDPSPAPGRTYVYRLVAVDRRGGTQTFGVGSVTVGRALPATIILHQNRPNPFNPSTSIAFELPEAAPMILCIYDASGRTVRTLAQGNLERGLHGFEWDGCDDSGRRVGSGIYLCRLKVDDRSLTRKLVMLK